jgi:hypothetical protein
MVSLKYILVACVWVSTCTAADPTCTACMGFTGLSIIPVVPGSVPTSLAEVHTRMSSPQNYTCSSNESRVDARGHEWCLLVTPDTGEDVIVNLCPGSNLAFVAMFNETLPLPRDVFEDNTRVASRDFEVHLMKQNLVGGRVWENDPVSGTHLMSAYVINGDMARTFGVTHGNTGLLYILNTSLPTNGSDNSTRFVVYADEASFVRTKWSRIGSPLIPVFPAPFLVFHITSHGGQDCPSATNSTTLVFVLSVVGAFGVAFLIVLFLHNLHDHKQACVTPTHTGNTKEGSNAVSPPPSSPPNLREPPMESSQRVDAPVPVVPPGGTVVGNSVHQAL